MQITIPFRVEYQTKEPVPIGEVVGSLLALQTILEEAGNNLETLFPGLQVESVKVHVQEISHGSLKEILLVGLFAYFQEDLHEELPPLVQELTGVVVPQNAETLLVIVALVSIVYGIDFMFKITSGTLSNSEIKRWKECLVEDLAAQTGASPDKVRAALDKRYAKPSRIKALANAASGFFRPSKSQQNAPIQVGQRKIEQKLIAEVPQSYVYEKELELERSEPHFGVTLALHQKDRDRNQSGWAAVPIGIFDRRLPLKLVDGVHPDQLWDSDIIVGDIVILEKRVGVDFVPYEIHLSRVQPS